MTSIVASISLAVLVTAAAGLFLGTSMANQIAYAANDENDTNNLRCTADPHDPKDSGNAHEPPNESGNPHFCPPIGQ